MHLRPFWSFHSSFSVIGKKKKVLVYGKRLHISYVVSFNGKKIRCFWICCCILKIRCMEGACIFNVWKAPAHLMWWLLMKKKTVFLNALLHLKYLFLWKIINTDSQHKPTSNSITICEWWYENSLRTIKLILKNKI